ncbi:MAG: hypothetical protein ACR2HH_15490, partial [Chthoniobacterales bacterium]
MSVTLHPHAIARLSERGASESDVKATVTTGERFPAKFGRTGFRRNFAWQGEWRGKSYATKQITAFAVEEAAGW